MENQLKDMNMESLVVDHIEDHMEGILGYWRHGKACNSGAEGFNNKVRWLVNQAYGLRDREYFKLKIYALPDTETTRSL